MSIQELRAKTGAGMSDCSKAFKQSNGDLEKAMQLLREWGINRGSGYTQRATSAGTIGTYVHHDGSVGVMVSLVCETDFVARTAEFKDLANKIAMHIAAASPKYVDRSQIPAEELETETKFARLDFEKRNMPEDKIQKALPGKLEVFYATTCLLDQPFIAEPKTKVGDLIKQLSGMVGENIKVHSFRKMGLND